jgi:hypothetical protein
MASERKKRCTNATCKANAHVRRAFPAERTTCPICGSPLVFIDALRPARKGSGKGGGKIVGRKVMGRVSSIPSWGRKPRKKKQPKKRGLQKDVGRKNVGRKR